MLPTNLLLRLWTHTNSGWVKSAFLLPGTAWALLAFLLHYSQVNPARQQSTQYRHIQHPHVSFTLCEVQMA